MKISILGGGGRVGLPLGIVLANNGHQISIIDLDKNRNDLINKREMPFFEKGALDLLRNIDSSNLKASEISSDIENTDVCILIIGTPVLDDGTPSANSLIELINTLVPHLRNVKLLMLRSTVYPGITRKLQNILKDYGLKTEIAFCPERIAEGNALKELSELPQIIGTDSESAFKLSSDVFLGISSEIIKTSIEEAELTKLFANAYRYLNFAIANEFFEICINNSINWENVWHAMKHNYPRASAFPKPGFAAGPCLVKDTQQLNYYYSNNFSLGTSALNVNENLPDFIINKLNEAYDLSQMSIGILGMTFKGDVDDFRSSLSFKLKNILEIRAKKVFCSDAVLTKEYFVSSKELIDKSDIIIIGTPHSEYKSFITDKPVVDIWKISNNQSLI